MARSYDDAVKLWAAKRYKVPRHKVTKVLFDLGHTAGGCDTCGYGEETFAAVTVYYEEPGNDRRFARAEKFKNISELMRQVIEAGAL